MILKQSLLVFILSFSSLSFSQDSLWIEFEQFETMVQNLPLDTSKHNPTRFENFELIWVRNVAHSHAEVKKGNHQLYQQDSVLFQENILPFDYFFPSYGYFRGEDYFVIEHHYNTNMSTIFNDIYYYKRKKIEDISDLTQTGSCAYGIGRNSVFTDETILPTVLDSALLFTYESFSDSVSMLSKDETIDTAGFYILRYGYSDKDSFSAYSGTEDVQCVILGNDLVVSYHDLAKLIEGSNLSSYGFGFPSRMSVGGKYLIYSGFYSAHGGTFDIENSHVYYFEKVK